MRQQTASELIHTTFPNCTRYCKLYQFTRNTFDCKLTCSDVKEITEESIRLVDLKESLTV